MAKAKARTRVEAWAEAKARAKAKARASSDLKVRNTLLSQCAEATIFYLLSTLDTPSILLAGC